jgi:uncharacterized protein YjeT (DUF2065 family)
MGSAALTDLLAALALVLVLEGLAIGLVSTRLVSLLEALREVDPERLRWGGLAMAALGTLGYLLIRG